MDSNALFSAVVEHKWLAVATLFIGLFVRLLKDDNGFPMTLPAVITIWSWVPIVGGRSFESKRVKPWIAVGLGLLYGALEKVAAGTSWKQALSDAAIAGLLPIVGHQLGIESIRDGKEVTVKLPDGGAAPGRR
jgi:hypothetical protein